MDVGVLIGVGSEIKVEWWPEDWSDSTKHGDYYIQRLTQNCEDNIAYCQAVLLLTEEEK